MKLPYFAKSADARRLMDVIKFVATRHGCSTYEVGLMITSFFESLADEVCQERPVTVPGFGTFAAVLIERKCDLARDPTPRCKPDFSPSVGCLRPSLHSETRPAPWLAAGKPVTGSPS